MSKSNGTIKKHPGTSTLARPLFSPGMLLQHEDLGQSTSYTRDLSRLLFKSFFGCGVICGLGVSIDAKCGKVCVTVRAGVALACSGDPIEVPKDQTFALDENCDPNLDSPLYVVLCGKVKQCAPRDVMCADDDEASTQPTRERDGFEIRVVTDHKCACGCDEPASGMKPVEERSRGDDHCLCADPACHTAHYAGICGCACGNGTDCGCECILLAKLVSDEGRDENLNWTVDHSVRRFIRPVLMRDPEDKPPEQPASEAMAMAQMSRDIADTSNILGIELKNLAVSDDTVDKLKERAFSAGVEFSKKSILADNADAIKTEAMEARVSAKSERAISKAETVLTETSAAAMLTREEADKAKIKASKADESLRKAIEERLTRYDAVVDAAGKLDALTKELAAKLNN